MSAECRTKCTQPTSLLLSYTIQPASPQANPQLSRPKASIQTFLDHLQPPHHLQPSPQPRQQRKPQPQQPHLHQHPRQQRKPHQPPQQHQHQHQHQHQPPPSAPPPASCGKRPCVSSKRAAWHGPPSPFAPATPPSSFPNNYLP